MNLAGALVRRIGIGLGVLLLVSVALFLVAEVLPGDAAGAHLGNQVTDEAREAVRHQLGLDRGVVERYLHWVWAAAHGDFGASLHTGEPVAQVIAEPVRNSAILAGITWILAVPLSGLFGILAGRNPGGRLDVVLSATAVTLVSIPQFVLAVLLIAVFATTFQWLPPVSLIAAGGTPLDTPEILVLPVCTLLLFAVPWCGRLVRAAIADLVTAPHVDAAMLAGVSAPVTATRHMLPSATGPIAQALGFLTSYLLGGTVVIELAFNYHGLGTALVAAIANHDTAVLEAAGLLLATVVGTALMLADIVGLLSTPKRRTGTI